MLQLLGLGPAWDQLHVHVQCPLAVLSSVKQVLWEAGMEAPVLLSTLCHLHQCCAPHAWRKLLLVYKACNSDPVSLCPASERLGQGCAGVAGVVTPHLMDEQCGPFTCDVVINDPK